MPRSSESWLPLSPTRELGDIFAATPTILRQRVGGAYVLLRTDGTRFAYPHGTSAVFYIGRSGANKGRLREHQKHASNARADLRSNGGRFSRYWWPRYGYAASFGAEVWWFDAKEPYTPSTLESMLVDYFYFAMGAPPVANGAWPKVNYPLPPKP